MATRRQRESFDREFAAASDILGILRDVTRREGWRATRRVLLMVIARQWSAAWPMLARFVADDGGGV